MPKSAPGPAPSTLPKSIIDALPSAMDVMKHVNALAPLLLALTKDLAKTEKNAVQLARAFVAFHRMMERIEDTLKLYNALYDSYKKEKVPALFEQAGVPNMSLDEGFRVGLSHKYYASIKSVKGDEAASAKLKDQAYAWLRENGLGDIISATVNAQTLSAAGKELLEDKNIELPSEFFNVAMVPNTSVTKL